MLAPWTTYKILRFQMKTVEAAKILAEMETEMPNAGDGAPEGLVANNRTVTTVDGMESIKETPQERDGKDIGSLVVTYRLISINKIEILTYHTAHLKQRFGCMMGK